ncbi:hypothetical protein LUR56_37940 [Streptomyces sp. MT29]|nr:hypothetical protein [Streptomyces sp. MT29]
MITIHHTRAEGTLIEGSSKGDGVYEIVRPHGFRYFPSIEAIGIVRSRDRAAQKGKISGAAAALRQAGFDVETVIDEDDRRPFTGAEAERAASAETAPRTTPREPTGRRRAATACTPRRASVATRSPWVSRRCPITTPTGLT